MPAGPGPCLITRAAPRRTSWAINNDAARDRARTRPSHSTRSSGDAGSVPTSEIAEAAALYEEAIRNLAKSAGETHPRLIEPLLNASTAQNGLKRYRQSKELLDRSLELSLAVLPPTHRVVQVIYYNMACLAGVQGQRDATLEFLKQAVEAGRNNPLMMEDEDLAFLHVDSEYEELAAVVQKWADEANIAANVTTATTGR
jgi:tetratricopeptide (TPR) repeat protein